MIINQRVYVTNDGRYVGEGDPDAAFLAFSAGTEVADREVQRLGLSQWATTGQLVRAPSVIISTDASGQRTMASAGSSRVLPVAPAVPAGAVPAGAVPVGTVPPGHATASTAGVPAEIADPVVNADGTHRGEQAVVRQTPPTRTTPAKPVRTTREV